MKHLVSDLEIGFENLMKMRNILLGSACAALVFIGTGCIAPARVSTHAYVRTPLPPVSVPMYTPQSPRIIASCNGITVSECSPPDEQAPQIPTGTVDYEYDQVNTYNPVIYSYPPQPTVHSWSYSFVPWHWSFGGGGHVRNYCYRPVVPSYCNNRPARTFCRQSSRGVPRGRH